MNNQLDDNMANHTTDKFNDKFENEIRQSYLGLSEKMPLPPSNTFSRIMDKINTEEKKQKESMKQSLSSMIFEFIHDTIMTPKIGWAVAGVQFAVIIFLFLSPPPSDMNNFQTLSIDAPAGQSVEINIVFKEDAMQKDIRQLLNDSGAIIINGPTESGLYILKVEQGHDFAIRLQAIGDSKIVKFVSKRY
ncbi:MAG: hypothetical protein KAJ62_00670 [Desulfobacteraceae bacterium]|nr:hypothetical protein [Desulfobacteraceae bacterium]